MSLAQSCPIRKHESRGESALCRKKADDDDDDGQSKRNVIAAISPFLNARPLPLFAKTPQTATLQRSSRAGTYDVTLFEEEYLHIVLEEEIVNNGAASLAVAVLRDLTTGDVTTDSAPRELPDGLPQQVLELDMLLRGEPRDFSPNHV